MVGLECINVSATNQQINQQHLQMVKTADCSIQNPQEILLRMCALLSMIAIRLRLSSPLTIYALHLEPKTDISSAIWHIVQTVCESRNRLQCSAS